MISAVHLTNRFFKKVKKTRTREFERNNKGIPFKFGIKILLLTLLPVIFFFLHVQKAFLSYTVGKTQIKLRNPIHNKLIEHMMVLRHRQDIHNVQKTSRVCWVVINCLLFL